MLRPFYYDKMRSRMAFPSWFEQPIYRLGGGCVIQLRHGNNLLNTLYCKMWLPSNNQASLSYTKNPANLYSPVRLGPEFAGCHAVLFFKLAVEVGHIVVAYLIGDGGDVVFSVA